MPSPVRAETAIEAYRQVMWLDPLLPRALWPDGYLGPEVYALHRQLMDAIRARL